MKLRITHPSIRGLTVLLDERGLMVGRGGGHVDLEMNWDRLVSRRHVRFWLEGGNVWFEDLGSKNGTWSGATRLAGVHPLGSGLSVLVGESCFTAIGDEDLEVPEMVTGELSPEAPRSPADSLDAVAERPLPPADDPGTADLSDLALDHVFEEVETRSLQGIQVETIAPPLAEPRPPLGEPRPQPAVVVLSRPPAPLHRGVTEAAPVTQGSPRGLPPLVPKRTPTGAGSVPPVPPLGSPARTPTVLDAPSPPPPVAPPVAPPSPVAPSPVAPSPVAPGSVPPPPPVPQPQPVVVPLREREAVVRVHPRFQAEKRVLVAVGAANELLPLWMENISKGGLFVRTDTPPPRGTKLQVAIETPGGQLELSAEVVHVVDAKLAAAFKQTAGVGLAFVNLNPVTREAIHRYVDGLSDRLEVPRQAPPPPPPPPVATPVAPAAVAPAAGAPAAAPPAASKQVLDKVMQRARELITAFEANDIYRALDVKPTSTGEELTQRIAELRAGFAAVEAQASPPQVARINGALKLIDRAAHLVTHPERRIEYDFRQGEVRALERIELGRQHKGPTVGELRGIWHRAMPDRLDKALVLVREAVAAKKDRDLVKAIRLGRAALELDPFHEELRRTVDAWQAQEGGPPQKKE